MPLIEALESAKTAYQYAAYVTKMAGVILDRDLSAFMSGLGLPYTQMEAMVDPVSGTNGKAYCPYSQFKKEIPGNCLIPTIGLVPAHEDEEINKRCSDKGTE